MRRRINIFALIGILAIVIGVPIAAQSTFWTLPTEVRGTTTWTHGQTFPSAVISNIGGSGARVVVTDNAGTLIKGQISDTYVATDAAISRSKIAAGTAGWALFNDGTTGLISQEQYLARSRGGTGITSTATFPASGTVAVLESPSFTTQITTPKIVFPSAGELTKTGTGVLTLATGADSSTLTKTGTGNLTLTSGADNYTLTVPATGTAALLGTAQTFTAEQTFAGILVDDGTNGRLTLTNAAATNGLYSTTTGFGAYKALELRASSYSIKSDGSNVVAALSSTAATINVGTTLNMSGSFLSVNREGTTGSKSFIRFNKDLGATAIGSIEADLTNNEFRLLAGSGHSINLGVTGVSAETVKIEGTAAKINVPTTLGATTNTPYLSAFHTINGNLMSATPTATTGAYGSFVIGTNTHVTGWALPTRRSGLSGAHAQFVTQTTDAGDVFRISANLVADGATDNVRSVLTITGAGAVTLGPSTGAPDLTHTLRSGTTSIATFAYNAATINVPVTVSAASLTLSNPSGIAGLAVDSSSTNVSRIFMSPSKTGGAEIYTGAGFTLYTNQAGTATQAIAASTAGAVTLGTSSGSTLEHKVLSGGNTVLKIQTSANSGAAGITGESIGASPTAVKWEFGHITGTTTMQARSGGSGGVQVSSGGTSWGAMSDMRYKDKISNLSDVLSKVSNLSVFTYQLKEHNKDTNKPVEVGLSAQEVIKIVPELVAGSEETSYMIMYDRIGVLAIKAIQESVVEYRSEIASLRAQNQCLANADTKEQRLACF